MIEMRIWDGDEVQSSDGHVLGVARSLHYRPAEEVNPAEQLYGVYLKVANFDLGDEFFIPVDFLDGREPEDNAAEVIAGEPVQLTVPLKFVMHRAWSRAPDFVAKKLGRQERLRRAERGTAA